jgi:hypothetical protein
MVSQWPEGERERVYLRHDITQEDLPGLQGTPSKERKKESRMYQKLYTGTYRSVLTSFGIKIRET